MSKDEYRKLNTDDSSSSRAKGVNRFSCVGKGEKDTKTDGVLRAGQGCAVPRVGSGGLLEVVGLRAPSKQEVEQMYKKLELPDSLDLGDIARGVRDLFPELRLTNVLMSAYEYEMAKDGNFAKFRRANFDKLLGNVQYLNNRTEVVHCEHVGACCSAPFTSRSKSSSLGIELETVTGLEAVIKHINPSAAQRWPDLKLGDTLIGLQGNFLRGTFDQKLASVKKARRPVLMTFARLPTLDKMVRLDMETIRGHFDSGDGPVQMDRVVKIIREQCPQFDDIPTLQDAYFAALGGDSTTPGRDLSKEEFNLFFRLLKCLDRKGGAMDEDQFGNACERLHVPDGKKMFKQVMAEGSTDRDTLTLAEFRRWVVDRIETAV
jgi:hypothetical protein